MLSRFFVFCIYHVYLGSRFILQLIEEETGPKLERLKKERDSYIEYQKIVREIEHLNKLYVAWQVSVIVEDLNVVYYGNVRFLH